LVLSLLVQTLLLVNNTLALADRVSLYRSSMVEGWSQGEELEIHVGLDTGRPKGLLDRVRRLMDTWGLEWVHGGQVVSKQWAKLWVTVTGTNVEPQATLEFYVEAVAQGGGNSYVLLNQTVTQPLGPLEVYTSSIALNQLFTAMGLPLDQDQTLDYYVWFRATATGLVSGHPVVVEIPYTHFDTLTIHYEEPVTKRIDQIGASYTHGYVKIGASEAYDSIHYVDMYDNNQRCRVGDGSQPIDAFIGFDFARKIPQNAVLREAKLNLRCALNQDAVLKVRIHGTRYNLATVGAAQILSTNEYFNMERTYASEDAYFGPWTLNEWYSYNVFWPLFEMLGNGVQDYGHLFLEFWRVEEETTVASHNYQYWWGLKAFDDYSMPYIEVTYVPYQASWYPTTLSLADIPLTLDLVALVTLMAATLVALRDSREEYRGAVAACTAILAVVILGQGGDAASWYPIPPLSVTLSHLFGLEETPRWFTVGVLSMVALATFETLRRRLS